MKIYFKRVPFFLKCLFEIMRFWRHLDSSVLFETVSDTKFSQQHFDSILLIHYPPKYTRSSQGFYDLLESNVHKNKCSKEYMIQLPKLSLKFLLIALLVGYIGVVVIYNLTRPRFPVTYIQTCGLDDFINGNCIREIKGHKEGDSFLPLFTENDWVFYVIREKQQKMYWGSDYTKEELLDVAHKELQLMQNREDGYDGKKEAVARIQSFIDILSKMEM